MMQFMGYRRPDGRAGVRNHVLVLSTVTCANTVVEKIGRALDDQAISIVHASGCGQGSDDLEQTHRVLLGTATHPNVGAVLLIGLGCESLDTVALAGEVATTGKPTEHFLIQDVGGTTSAVEHGVAIARELLAVTAETKRESIDISELIVAVECGASDAFSAVTANPAAGVVADRVVEADGTFMFSEVDECIGAEHILARRARSDATAQKLLEFIGRREREAAAAGIDLMGAQINPGNFEGGLTTPEEKSLGAILKGGTSRIEEVISHAHRPTRRGLIVMDSPGDDIESIVGMVAGGAQIVLFTTGRGTPVGNPIAPVIKIATNSALYRHMAENMDIDAGTILESEETIKQVGGRIFEKLLAVAGGELTQAELLGHREFTINRIGPRL